MSQETFVFLERSCHLIQFCTKNLRFGRSSLQRGGKKRSQLFFLKASELNSNADHFVKYQIFLVGDGCIQHDSVMSGDFEANLVDSFVISKRWFLLCDSGATLAACLRLTNRSKLGLESTMDCGGTRINCMVSCIANFICLVRYNTVAHMSDLNNVLNSCL